MADGRGTGSGGDNAGKGGPSEVKGVLSETDVSHSSTRDRSPNAAPAAVENNAIVIDILTIRNAGEEMKKGFLSSMNTMANLLLIICLGILSSSAVYSVVQVSLGNKTGAWIDVISVGGIIAIISSSILVVRASYLKDSKSIKGFGDALFKWPLLLVLGYLYAVFCILILQRFANNNPGWVLRMIGIVCIGFCLIVVGGFWFFSKKWPKILDEINTGYVGENGTEMSARAGSNLPAEAHWTGVFQRGILDQVLVTTV